MIYSTYALQIANQRINDLQRSRWRDRLRGYPDGERQPRTLKYWANR